MRDHRARETLCHLMLVCVDPSAEPFDPAQDTDVPFAETKAWIAGFDLFECASLEEAIRIAAWHPMARFGRIEVRPLSAED